MQGPSFTVQFDVTIRSAIHNDLRKLEWGGEYWKYRQIFQRTFEEQEQGNRMMLIAEANDFPIGQMFMQFSKGNVVYADGRTRAYLYALRVMEPFRQRGIGTRLIEFGEQAAIDRGFRTVTIAVAKDNPGALRLYERLGYATFGEDPGRWSFTDPAGRIHNVEEPCYAMKKRLDLKSVHARVNGKAHI